ncbi:PCRF domain-containing protein [Patescibacteria group bacterium]|nr:PCRF domain-containing protein [Patescibacteria group bacterium]
MLEKLKKIADKYELLSQQLYDPEIGADQQKAMKINRELSSLRESYELYKQIETATHQLDEAKHLLETESDPDTIELAKAQLEEAQAQLEGMDEKVQLALLPQDPNDDKNIFLEIRPAAGGDESGLFAAELLRMYLRYAERNGWKAEVIEHERSGIG